MNEIHVTTITQDWLNKQVFTKRDSIPLNPGHRLYWYYPTPESSEQVAVYLPVYSSEEEVPERWGTRTELLDQRIHIPRGTRPSGYVRTSKQRGSGWYFVLLYNRDEGWFSQR